MAPTINWHTNATKLHHCHPTYRVMSGRAAPGCDKAAAAFWCRRLIRIVRQLLAVIDGTDGRTPMLCGRCRTTVLENSWHGMGSLKLFEIVKQLTTGSSVTQLDASICGWDKHVLFSSLVRVFSSKHSIFQNFDLLYQFSLWREPELTQIAIRQCTFALIRIIS